MVVAATSSDCGASCGASACGCAGLHASGDLKHIARSLAAAKRRVKGWAVGERDGPALRSGLERVYRRGRKALAETESEDTDENLHELRKQAKYLALALEVFKPTPSHAIARLARRAEAVADRLGADRDLAVLRDRVVALPAPSIQAHEALIAQIARSRAKPQKKALEAGRRLYRKKAKAVGRRFEAAL